MKNGWLCVIMSSVALSYLFPQHSSQNQLLNTISTTNRTGAGSGTTNDQYQSRDIAQLVFKAHAIDTDFRFVNSIYIADVDGDGDKDVIGAASWPWHEIAWWENLDVGSGSFFKHSIDSTSTAPYVVYAVDLDKDGDTDVIGGTESTNEIAWWENKGSGKFTKHVIDSNLNGPRCIYAVDLDKDGDIDVLGGGLLSLVWYKNDGSQNFSKQAIGSSTSNNSVQAIDMDKDGDLDVVVASGNSINWFENNGNQVFTLRSVSSYLNLAYCVFAVDLDKDGDTDVLGVERYGNRILWLENDGTQKFVKSVIDTAINYASWVYATDLDNDTDIDILAVSNTSSYVCWYENKGSKIFEKHIIQSNFSGACSVYADDLDNDGDIDVLAAASYANAICWLENTVLTSPNRPAPNISVAPDSVYFYVGPAGAVPQAGSLSQNWLRGLRQPTALNRQSANEDTVVFTIRNTGNATLYVQSMSWKQEWITKIDTPCFLLKPGKGQSVRVCSSAEDLFNGRYRDTLAIASNDPDTPVWNLPLVIDMKGAPEVNYVNEVEPNNSSAQAQRLSGPSPIGVKGKISVSDVGAISVLSDDIEDLYVFTTQSRYIKIRLFDLSADLDMYLMAISGNITTVWGTKRGGTLNEKYVKTDLAPGTYYIGVSIYDRYPIQDSSTYSLTVEFDPVTEVERGDDAIPLEFSLRQNYPNPFNPSTTIRYDIPRMANVSLKIYNTLGQVVASLVEELKEPGRYEVKWNPDVSSGIYFCRLQARDASTSLGRGYVETKKLVVLK